MLDPDPTTRVQSPPARAGSTELGPQALQILMTEHWSLLAARSLVYTESMSRTSIFVAALTGSVVSLALVGQATDFEGGFVAFSLVLLPVVYFLGVATAVRLAQVNWEDAVWMQGMNRIRHAYLELAPELEPYFVTSKHDDDEGVLLSSLATRRVVPQIQGFIAIPGVIAVLDAVVAGAIAAIAALGLGAGPALAVVTGVLVFVVVLAGFAAFAVWAVTTFRGTLDIRFPSPPDRPPSV